MSAATERARLSAHRHADQQLGAADVAYPVQPSGAVEAPEDQPTDEDGASAERPCLEEVRAAPDPAAVGYLPK